VLSMINTKTSHREPSQVAIGKIDIGAAVQDVASGKQLTLTTRWGAGAQLIVRTPGESPRACTPDSFGANQNPAGGGHDLPDPSDPQGHSGTRDRVE